MESSFLANDDDDATLQAALSFLDDCDDLPRQNFDTEQEQDVDATLDIKFSEFTDHVDIPAAAEHNDTIEPRKVAVDSTTSKSRRVTPKQEICKLQLQERELTIKLENERLEAFNRTQRGTSSKSKKALPFWKKISSRQFQRRLDSERENRRLKSLVALHVGRAKRLEKALKRQMAAEGIRNQNSRSISASSPDALDAPDLEAVFKKLTAEVDATYARIDKFLAGSRQHLQNQVSLLEHSDTSSLPFERQAVELATWHALGSRFITHQQSTKITSDAIKSSVVRSLNMQDMNLCLRIHWVGRKFREVNRTVIIIRTLVEPQYLQIPAGVCFEETQVSIVMSGQSSENDENDADAEVRTNIETHVSVTGNGPKGASGNRMRWWVASPGGVAARNTWIRAIRMRKDAIEDRVFEETRAC